MAAVHRYQILDTPPDAEFDRITALAARLFDVPIAIMGILDVDRIWFKSVYGPPSVVQVELDAGLSDSAAILARPWVVADSGTDPQVRTNPLMAGHPRARFGAGVPLTTADGYNLGTLSVLDSTPRAITENELVNLRDLAALVMDELELRRLARQTLAHEERLRQEAEELADALQASLLPPRPPALPGMELATRYLPGQQGLKVAGDFFDVFRLGHNDWGILLGDACGKGVRPASLAALARWTVRASSVHQFSPSEVLRDLNRALVSEQAPEDDDRYCSAVFGRLELDTCGAWLTVANAGHPLPLLVRRSGRVQRRGTPALPLGLFPSVDPVDHRVGLAPGDSLVFYTDGITEARSGTGEPLGEERLLAELRTLTGRPAEEIAERVVGTARSFCGGSLVDDVAVAVVRVPDEARRDPLNRVISATGLPPDRLSLPGYPHEDAAATEARRLPD